MKQNKGLALCFSICAAVSTFSTFLYSGLVFMVDLCTAFAVLCGLTAVIYAMPDNRK